MNESNKCFNCNKKLKLINFTCKCDKIFCINCKFPEVHYCTFNYKIQQQNKLENDNPVITPDKLNKIT